jgi:hypothetical protein
VSCRNSLPNFLMRRQASSKPKLVWKPRGKVRAHQRPGCVRPFPMVNTPSLSPPRQAPLQPSTRPPRLRCIERAVPRPRQ